MNVPQDAHRSIFQSEVFNNMYYLFVQEASTSSGPHPRQVIRKHPLPFLKECVGSISKLHIVNRSYRAQTILRCFVSGYRVSKDAVLSFKLSKVVTFFLFLGAERSKLVLVTVFPDYAGARLTPVSAGN